jgi:TPR repeat protein
LGEKTGVVHLPPSPSGIILSAMKLTTRRRLSAALPLCGALATAVVGCGGHKESDTSGNSGPSPAIPAQASKGITLERGTENADPVFSQQRARKVAPPPSEPSNSIAVVDTISRSTSGATNSSASVTLAGTNDFAAAVKRFQKLQAQAATGDPEAKLNLARAFSAGDGVGRDEAVAQQLFQEAAQAGNPQAQQSLYLRSLAGLGTSGNPSEALQWLATAAAGGYPPSQVLLGTAYLEGQTGGTNYAEAARWFQAAAEAGDLGGQLRLGNLLANGPDDLKNDLEAYKWLYVATARNVPSAPKALEALAARMAPDDIETAKQLALPLIPPINPVLHKDP